MEPGVQLAGQKATPPMITIIRPLMFSAETGADHISYGSPEKRSVKRVRTDSGNPALTDITSVNINSRLGMPPLPRSKSASSQSHHPGSRNPTDMEMLARKISSLSISLTRAMTALAKLTV